MTQHGTYQIEPCTCGAEIGVAVVELLVELRDRLAGIERRVDDLESAVYPPVDVDAIRAALSAPLTNERTDPGISGPRAVS